MVMVMMTICVTCMCMYYKIASNETNYVIIMIIIIVVNEKKKEEEKEAAVEEEGEKQLINYQYLLIIKAIRLRLKSKIVPR